MQDEADSLLKLFADEPQINTPMQGEVRGQEVFRHFVADQQTFLTTHHAQPHFLNAILTPERIIVEFTVDMAQNGEPFDIPVAIVCDRNRIHL